MKKSVTMYRGKTITVVLKISLHCATFNVEVFTRSYRSKVSIGDTPLKSQHLGGEMGPVRLNSAWATKCAFSQLGLNMRPKLNSK